MRSKVSLAGSFMITAFFCIIFIFGFSSEVLSLGESMNPAENIGFTIPSPHESTDSVHSFIRGFNFLKLPENSLYSSSFIISKNTHDLFDRKKLFIPDPELQKSDVMDQIRGDSGTILALAMGTIAFLYVMPESFSKWADDDKTLDPQKLWKRYDKNVSRGPVWDKDEWEVNYIGHPYFGAAYYSHAMNQNYTRLESLTYSFMMSACLYEYGLEAFFEDPSIQDIIVTPLGGAIFGEVFIRLKNSIKENNDRVLGSKTLGSVCMFVLDPITSTLEPINRFNEKYTKMRMESTYYSKSAVYHEGISSPGTIYDHRVGVEISIYTNAFSR